MNTKVGIVKKGKGKGRFVSPSGAVFCVPPSCFVFSGAILLLCKWPLTGDRYGLP